MTISILAVVGMLLGGGPDCSRAQVLDELSINFGGPVEKYYEFFFALRDAVQAGNTAFVAKNIRYPISFYVDGQRITVSDETQFLKFYEAAFNEKVRSAILTTSICDRIQNYQGVAYSSGALWFEGVCHDNSCMNYEIKVIGINNNIGN